VRDKGWDFKPCLTEQGFFFAQQLSPFLSMGFTLLFTWGGKP
jgi:hypothetical protein